MLPKLYILMLFILFSACGRSTKVTHFGPQNNSSSPEHSAAIGYASSNDNNTKTLHLLDSKGQPLTGFKPIEDLGAFALSSKFVVFTVQDRTAATQPSFVLHILDSSGIPLPGFKPIPGITEVVSATNNYIVYTSHGPDPFSLTVHFLDTKGQPIERSLGAGGIAAFTAFDNLFAFLNSDPLSINPIYSLKVIDSQGVAVPNFPLTQVIADFSISNKLIAYTTDKESALGSGSHTLHLLDKDGQPLVATNSIPQVQDFSVSDSLVAYTTPDRSNSVSRPTYDLHLLDSTGKALPGFLPIHGCESNMSLSKSFVVYFSYDEASGSKMLHVLNTEGQAIPNFKSVSAVQSAIPSSTLIGYLTNYNESKNTSTLHLLGSDGQNLSGFTPIEGVNYFGFSEK